MREILFRGKILGLTDWSYGYYAKSGENHFVLLDTDNEDNYSIVDPETVGQYTGVRDKNGKRIFEGDIIEVDRIYDTPQPRPRRFTVEWEESSGFFPLTIWDGGDYFINTNYCKVIGNIHDNPELLEVKK